MMSNLIEINTKYIDTPEEYRTKEDMWIEGVFQSDLGWSVYSVLITSGDLRGEIVRVYSDGVRDAVPTVLRNMRKQAKELKEYMKENITQIRERTTLQEVSDIIALLEKVINARERR